MNNSYIIISTIKNQEDTINSTLESVINQTILPAEWLIVDDLSTDNSANIIKEYTKTYSWIKYLKNNEVLKNEKGARIASIINTHLKYIQTKNFEFIAKLDGDILLPRNFYEYFLLAFHKHKNLGIASGSLKFNGKVEKNIYPELTRGATKFYRRSCFIDIKGLQLTTGWDSLDNIIAQKQGWTTQTLEITFDHLEEEGVSQGFIQKYYQVGRYCGKIPYHTWYFIAKVAYNVFKKPILFSSLIMIYGYIEAKYIVKERPFPKDVSNYFRSKQRNLLIGAIKNILNL